MTHAMLTMDMSSDEYSFLQSTACTAGTLLNCKTCFQLVLSDVIGCDVYWSQTSYYIILN